MVVSSPPLGSTNPWGSSGIGNELQRVIPHVPNYRKKGLLVCRLVVLTKLGRVCEVDLSYSRVGWRDLKFWREFFTDAFLVLCRLWREACFRPFEMYFKLGTTVGTHHLCAYQEVIFSDIFEINSYKFIHIRNNQIIWNKIKWIQLHAHKFK